jgi:hypothetical protein
MSAADAIKAFIEPILPGWRTQFGRWDDVPTQRCAVIKPSGGASRPLLREPAFTLHLISAAGDATSVARDAAEAVVAATKAVSGELVALDAGEPAYWWTSDGRHAFDISLSAMQGV